MKHHEYQIYYGGFKIKLKGYLYCKDCLLVTTIMKHKKILNNVRSHKKQTVKPRSGALLIKEFNGLLRKHVISKKN